jgi:hypothetical protein
LIQQMLCGVRWRKFLLVMIVKNIVSHIT